MSESSRSPNRAEGAGTGTDPGRLAPGITAGLLAAGGGLAVGELVAGFDAGARSPLAVIGDRIIDLVPLAVERWAVDLFGTGDKAALLVGMALALTIISAGVGVRTLRSRRAVEGMIAAVLLGVLGAAIGITGRQGGPARAWPSLVAGVAGAIVLWVFHRQAVRDGSGQVVGGAPSQGVVSRVLSTTADGDVDRRRFLVLSGAIGASAVAVGGIGRLLQSRSQVAAERAALVLPSPRNRLPPLPPDPARTVPGLSTFITPQNRFYRIDTAFVTPRVSIDDWQLTVTGMVRKPLTLSFDDLLARPLIETDVTIACVSNEVGGGLVGNARWLGARLDDLLEEAGIEPDADQIVGRSVDGWTGGFPVEVLDGRDGIIAVAMNGEPLSPRHGYPARLVVPGLYGYVSATKWLSRIELTRFDRFEGYWVPRGWSARGPIKLQSRIDTPRAYRTIDAVTTPIAGVAWAPPVGIGRVDVRVDDGPWQAATLGPEHVSTTWRQWWLSWDPAPGSHVIQCRATDATGAPQTEKRRDVVPDGATGLHTITVPVRSRSGP
ncbi:MAG: molybdopterin-dependent oxidoreductase [Actinobacteria bacterium]|nr:molybdopterin-dependent oxidoreductase [Actinomycetota bacterium]